MKVRLNARLCLHMIDFGRLLVCVRDLLLSIWKIFFLVRLHFANIGLLEVQSPFVTCLALLWTRIEVKKQTVANFQ